MVPSFHWLDYVLCALSLLMSLSVGVYHGVKGMFRRGQEAEEFLMGGRNLHPLPVSLSVFVSWLSAIAFIGDPVEVYYNGVVYIFVGVGYCLALPPVAHMFAKKYNQMQLTSVNEYLNIRYNHLIQMFVSITMILCTILYLGIVIYAPSVALSQVSGIDDWISILLIGSVSTFYTVFGGMKAVVWADALQSGIMFIGLIAILTQGIINVGGFQNMLKIAKAGNRLNFTKNSWSPLVRSTAWSYLVGGFFRVFVPYSSSQAFVQRYCAMSSPKKAKLTVYLNIPMFMFLITSFALIGLTMFAYYHGCDPLKEGRIKSPDQLVPLFMLEMLGFLPGLPGVFLASIFAASLSSVSSMINAFAANIVKDFVEPIYEHRKGKRLPDHMMSVIAKVTTLFFGILTTTIAFITLYVKVNIFPLTAKITGMFMGPISALFFIGICFVFIETWSVLIASAMSLCVCLWLGFGAFLYSPPSEALKTYADQCHNNFTNFTVNSGTANDTSYLNFGNGTIEPKGDFNIFDFYNLSPLLYCPLGYILTFILALMLTAFKLCLANLPFGIKRKQKFVIINNNEGTGLKNFPLGNKSLN